MKTRNRLWLIIPFLFFPVHQGFGQETFPTGSFDQYGVLTFQEFDKPSAEVTRAIRLIKAGSPSKAYEALFNKTTENWSNLAFHKTLADAGFASGRAKALIEWYAKTAALRKEPEVHLALALMVYRSFYAKVNPSVQAVKQARLSLGFAHRESRGKSIAYRAQVAIAYLHDDVALARSVLENLVRQHSRVYRLRIVLSYAYLEGITPFIEKNGRMIADVGAKTAPKPTSALRHAQAALDLEPRSSSALWCATMAALQLGKPDEAKSYLHRLVAIVDSGSEWHARAMKLLESLK